MGFEVKVRGSVDVFPQPTAPERLSKPGFALDLTKQYSETDGGTFTIGSTPVTVELGGSTLLRLIGLRSIDPLNPTVLVTITQPGGSAQSFKLSDLVLLHNPAAGSEVTILTITGPGRIEFVVAGDPSS
jgi:hypothetical protein